MTSSKISFLIQKKCNSLAQKSKIHNISVICYIGGDWSEVGVKIEVVILPPTALLRCKINELKASGLGQTVNN